MPADFKIKYPASNGDTTAFTITMASLASDTNLLAGRASTAIDNRTNLDQDIVIGGQVALGTSPTVSTTVEIWGYTPISIASGTPTYPDSITGTDANKTMTSRNVLYSALVLLKSITVDATSNRIFPIADISLAQVYGYVPEFFGLFIVQNTAAALNATQTTGLNYRRVQNQSV